MYMQLIASRVITGIAYGLGVAPTIIYVAELSHASLRGRMSSMPSLLVAFAMLIVYWLGYMFPVRIIFVNT